MDREMTELAHERKKKVHVLEKDKNNNNDGGPLEYI
jgi:hypothetical protein